MIRDLSPIPNVLWFEYCTQRNESRSRLRKGNCKKNWPGHRHQYHHRPRRHLHAHHHSHHVVTVSATRLPPTPFQLQSLPPEMFYFCIRNARAIFDCLRSILMFCFVMLFWFWYKFLSWMFNLTPFGEIQLFRRWTLVSELFLRGFLWNHMLACGKNTLRFYFEEVCAIPSRTINKVETEQS